MHYEHARIKSNARTFFSVNTGNSILCTLAYFGVTYGVSFVGALFNLAVPYIVTYGIMIFIIIPLQFGYTVWFRDAIYAQRHSVGELFMGFGSNYLSYLGTVLLKNLFIFLWSLLFYFPGIIKSYAYRMTDYIKAENPNLSASRCIELSMRMTDGHKGDLFYLDLSFLGWNLLSALTFGILSIVYVMPYQMAANAFAYEELKAEAIASGKIAEGELYGYSLNNSDY